MKKTKIIAAVLLALLAVVSLCSCGEKTDEGNNAVPSGDFDVTVKISSDVYGVLVEGSVGVDEGATVLDAITAYCAAEGIECTYNDELTSVVALGEYKEVERDKLSYYWSYTLNGKEPKGRAAENTVSEGDVVVYNYTFIPTGDYVTVRFEAEGKVVVDDITVVYDEGDTVLDAALDALKRSGVEYGASDDNTAIQYVDDYLAKITPIYDETWDAEVNGEAVAEPSEAVLSNEAEIVFTFNRVEKEVTDTQA